MSALAGGVFGTDNVDGDDADLRLLIHELGQRSYDASLGRRGIPDPLDTDLWCNLEATGLARLTSTDDTSAGPHELALTLYGLARHAAAVPLAETDPLAGWLAAKAGIDLPDGPLTVALADVENDCGPFVGTAHKVPWARDAAAVLMAVRNTAGFYVGIVSPSVTGPQKGNNLAGEPRDSLSFNLAASEVHDVDPALHAELLIRGAWSRCIQIVGVLDTAATLSVAHTRERVQFGRPLRAFQSVQQSLAIMAGEIERARAATELAVTAAAAHGFDSPNTDYAVTVAKIAVGRAIGPVTTIAHQLHGAIGVTSEHPLWLFTTRAQSWAQDYGTTAHFARRLGWQALAAADPWDLITGDLTQFDNGR